jgi:hypothetical protein
LVIRKGGKKKTIMHHSEKVHITSLEEATTVLTFAKSVGVYFCGQQALKLWLSLCNKSEQIQNGTTSAHILKCISADQDHGSPELSEELFECMVT